MFRENGYNKADTAKDFKGHQCKMPSEPEAHIVYREVPSQRLSSSSFLYMIYAKMVVHCNSLTIPLLLQKGSSPEIRSAILKGQGMVHLK